MSGNNNSSSAGGGIGFVGALAILFIALKLTNVIDWDWWWVLSPLWIGFGLVVLIFVGVFGVIWTAALIEERASAKRLRSRR
jgi:hypothetical protein